MRLKNALAHIIIGLLIGAAILCLGSAFGKIIMEVNFLLPRGYIIPFSFGSISGALVGYFWYRSKMHLIARMKMEEKAITDELTGLYNRRGFFALANHQIRLANRSKKNVLLIYTDMDNLKNINDTVSHQKGDKAIIETANILKNTFRKSDIIARIGGDEFVIFPIDAEEDNYEEIISHLRTNIKIFNKDNKDFKLSLSAGKAVYDHKNPISTGELLSIADKEMYKEKEDKKNFSSRKYANMS